MGLPAHQIEADRVVGEQRPVALADADDPQQRHALHVEADAHARTDRRRSDRAERVPAPAPARGGAFVPNRSPTTIRKLASST